MTSSRMDVRGMHWAGAVAPLRYYKCVNSFKDLYGVDLPLSKLRLSNWGEVS
ncbi:hypothetical protein ABIG06_001497 [Bradyrhizobium sp. USDA 326]